MSWRRSREVNITRGLEKYTVNCDALWGFVEDRRCSWSFCGGISHKSLQDLFLTSRSFPFSLRFGNIVYKISVWTTAVQNLMRKDSTKIKNKNTQAVLWVLARSDAVALVWCQTDFLLSSKILSWLGIKLTRWKNRCTSKFLWKKNTLGSEGCSKRIESGIGLWHLLENTTWMHYFFSKVGRVFVRTLRHQVGFSALCVNILTSSRFIWPPSKHKFDFRACFVQISGATFFFCRFWKHARYFAIQKGGPV